MIEMDQKANISTLFKSFLSIWSVQFWRNPSSAARFAPGFFSSFLSQRGLKPGLLQSRRRTLSNAMLDLKIQWKMHFLYRGNKRLFFSTWERRSQQQAGRSTWMHHSQVSWTQFLHFDAIFRPQWVEICQTFHSTSPSWLGSTSKKFFLWCYIRFTACLARLQLLGFSLPPCRRVSVDRRVLRNLARFDWHLSCKSRVKQENCSFFLAFSLPEVDRGGLFGWLFKSMLVFLLRRCEQTFQVTFLALNISNFEGRTRKRCGSCAFSWWGFFLFSTFPPLAREVQLL